MAAFYPLVNLAVLLHLCLQSSPEDQESMSGKEGGKKRKEGKLLRTSVKTIGKARVLIGQTICR